ncbi:carbohydrate kinase [Haloferula chungangensis]|uniref:Carbohydrate kinase n=1 Tax=Haloferula chungangensis TaxID=1048331 RepID=A0ABW2LAE7_9BACT
MNKNPNKPRIVGLGEVLWDMLSDSGRLGGAPANFACHCHQLGGESYPVSCVGDDELGHQARAELAKLGISSEFVQESSTHPTGQVQVTLDPAGKPSYQILEDMAWDHLEFTPEFEELAASLDAACFGVLAQRSPKSRASIQAFLKHMPEGALRILDVNLRAPFFSKPRVEESLELATILKLSDEELPVLADYFELEGSETEKLSALLKRFELDLVVYTCGAEGSILLSKDETHRAPGVETTAIDSVGAGDSFTATLCIGLLKGRPLPEINTRANQVAAYVCSQKGACPELPAHLKTI